MGILDGAADLFGRESAIFVGLLIPFLGLLVPAIALFAIGLSHRMAPHVATAKPGVLIGDGATPRYATAAPRRPPRRRPGRVVAVPVLRESDAG